MKKPIIETSLGRWYCNVYPGRYVILPGKGVAITDINLIELVSNAVLGPPQAADNEMLAKFTQAGVLGIYVQEQESLVHRTNAMSIN